MLCELGRNDTRSERKNGGCVEHTKTREKLKMEGGGRDVKNNHSEGMAVFIPRTDNPLTKLCAL